MYGKIINHMLVSLFLMGGFSAFFGIWKDNKKGFVFWTDLEKIKSQVYDKLND